MQGRGERPFVGGIPSQRRGAAGGPGRRPSGHPRRRGRLWVYSGAGMKPFVAARWVRVGAPSGERPAPRRPWVDGGITASGMGGHMRVAMVGAGYVGLVSGACFAEFGVEVCVADTDAAKVAALREGRIPIYEPGLDRLVADNAREGRLSFTTELAEAVGGAEAVFLAVGTPSRRGDGHA